MSRKLKNVLMICLLVVSIVIFGLTVYFANKDKYGEVVNNYPAEIQMNKDDFKPWEENMQDRGEKPDKFEGRPNRRQDMTNESEDDSEELDFPKDEDERLMQNRERPDDLKEFEKNHNKESNTIQQDSITQNKPLNITFIALFAIESLVIAFVSIYLVMSKFNKKSVRETFKLKDDIIIYVLTGIILTALITMGISYLI